MKKKIISIIVFSITVFSSVATSVVAAQYKAIEQFTKIDKYESAVQTTYMDLEDEFGYDNIGNEDVLKINLPRTSNSAESKDYIMSDVMSTTVGDMLTYGTIRSLETLPGMVYSGDKTSTTTVSNSKYSVVKEVKFQYSRTTAIPIEWSTNRYKFGKYIADNFVMPGMNNTNVAGSNCNYMTPQGIEYAMGYIFITAYCDKSGHNHNSVIYVLDGTTKKYITTLVLTDDTHAGGITYINYYLWIADAAEKGGNKVYFYKFSEIRNAIEYARVNSGVKSVDLSGYTHGEVYLDGLDRTDFITTYNGYLCSGEFYTNKNGDMKFYWPVPSDGYTLSATGSGTVPKKTQGVYFYEAGSNTYLAMSTSYGRNSDSHIFVFLVIEGTSSSTLVQKKELIMPCMTEELVVINGKTYIVFESCAYKYRQESTVATYVIDRVCGMSYNLLYK